MDRLRHIHHTCKRAGFTLVELLVASTIALVVMGAVASLFGVFSRASTNSQAIVGLSSRMRSTANRLRQDLVGLTAPLTPPLSRESDAGYFELIEGPWTDAFDGSGNLITGSSTTAILADTDDVLLFTTRSSTGPFEGNYAGNQIESSTAEVAWFCRPSTTQPVPGLQLQTLYRRQLLVVGYVGAPPFYVAGSGPNNQVAGTIPAIYSTYDISLRSDPTVSGALVPNTLADLTNRENRFFHGPTWAAAFPSTLTNLTFDGTTREGEDVVLTNVIAFDVRVFDPDATARVNGSTVVYPNEQTYTTATALLPVGFTGCFLDLGCSTAAATVLSGTGNSKSRLAKTGIAGTATYDTWSTAYETNGIDDDGDAIVDDATNGVDNDGDNIPDDADETETAPPYSRPLRAIEIRIRCYDPTSREIRQTTVRHTFTN
ncbi:MAG: prepilin-type N-terminal cleavage/methylation domain-containing protein [Planctomycetia bacterium]|nr:prepilin-type N-terminal cleavage/methylation domain-containing protein [Planctomycetia bacterium]